MPLFRCCALVFLTVGFAAVANAQGNNKTFPTDEEIKLLLTQTERAMQQYSPLIDQEEIQMGKGTPDAFARDRQVVNALETAVKTFKDQPQGFNGPFGFAFFEWLDDAGRNALLCGNGALLEATKQLASGNTSRVSILVHLSQSCSDVSTLIYTVSENAGSLYQRYAQAEEQLGTQAVEVMQKCTDIVKKSGITPKK